MTSEQIERRFSDQEVALVLQRTAELEERRAHLAPDGRGVSRQELEAIARDVGFSLEALDAALREMQRGTRLPSHSILGPGLSARRVSAVRGRLDPSDLGPLIQAIEDRIATTGTVTEAIGAVRWTSVPSGNNLGAVTQVSFTPGTDDTHIQVSRRYTPQTRAILHFVPGLWGGIIGGVAAAGAGLAGLGVAVSLVGAAAAGLAIGRGIWRALARRNHDRVDRLTSELADEARRAVERRATPAS